MIYGCSYEEVREKEIERKAGVEKTAGFFLMLFIVAGTFAVVYGILYVANLIHPVLRFCLETFFIYQILATKSLKTESMKVYKKLKREILSEQERKFLIWLDVIQRTSMRAKWQRQMWKLSRRIRQTVLLRQCFL